MKYSSRFFLYAPVALVVLIAAGVSFHWSRTATAFEAKLAALKGHEAIPGVTLDWSKATVSGFPFRIDAVFENFAAHGQGPHGPFRWQSQRFALHGLTYGAQKDVFEAAGVQQLEWTDAADQPHRFSFEAGSLHASAVRNASGLARFDVDAIQLVGQGLTMGRAQFHMRRGADGSTIDMMVSGDVLKGEMGFFGASVRSLRLYQTLHGAEAYAGLLKGEASPAAAHAAWHDKGGMAAVTATELNGHPNTMRPEHGGTINALLEALY